MYDQLFRSQNEAVIYTIFKYNMHCGIKTPSQHAHVVLKLHHNMHCGIKTPSQHAHVVLKLHHNMHMWY